MKRFLLFLMLAAVLAPVPAWTAQVAHARLYCYSLHFLRGEDQFGLYSLDLTSIYPDINGELAPWWVGSYTHIADFFLNDPTGFDPLEGTLAVNVPPNADANHNGFPDFFEVSQPVSATTSGLFVSFGGNGTVTAAWSRPAGSKDGTCRLRLMVSGLGLLGEFTHPFELLEYTGPVAYTPGTDAVDAVFDLAQTGNSFFTLQGPARFVKDPADRFNLLETQPGQWTNAWSAVVTYTDNYLERDARWPTNYSGWMDFDDGDSLTFAPDYVTWLLSIDDPNDRDLDGIPDFSDDPASSGPRRPTLTLQRGTTNLLLQISGDVGYVHELQQTAALPATNWQTVVSLTLTNDPQVVPMPWSAGTPRFWRAVAR